MGLAVTYMLYEGLNLANQKSRKLGYLAGSWRGALPFFIDSLKVKGEMKT